MSEVGRVAGALTLRGPEVWPQDRLRSRAYGLRAGFTRAVVVLALLPAACGGGGNEASDLRWEVEVTPAPHRVGDATLRVALTDAEGRPVEGAQLHVEATMSHAGMVPEFADASETSPGSYEASFEFTMGGDWILLLDATTGDGTQHHWEQDVPNVSSKASNGG